ncbi:metallophosphoesterase family protein [Niallia taxi]|uniref:metallophosphoesterase family protein n=1 Tax=Niallia taxi TaxID=2499688 RepID=UPI002E246A64|nr:metallophosphoesterase family protein [Niallia taxi]
MKMAVIADVHGNLPALKAVFSALDLRKDIKHIYCLGDMIGIGPYSNEVLHLLFSRKDVSMITGNHDEAVLALAKGEEYPTSHSSVRRHHQWILDRLDRSFIPHLENLPRRIIQNIEGHSVLFCHYQFKKDHKDQPISKDPFSSIVSPSKDNLEKLFRNHNEELICFGHHHPTHFFTGKEATYLNPGSLGCNHKPAAPYAIINFSKKKFEITLQETEYDNEDFLKSYYQLEVPEREFILKVFHGNQM